VTDALPPQLWTKLKAFLDAGKTGQIVLEVKDGRVQKLGLTEWERAGDACPVANGRPIC
jgi:hypothetical protein